MKPLGTPMLEITVIDESDVLRDIAEMLTGNVYAAQPLPTGVFASVLLDQPIEL
jgi:hypothetical protein